LMTLGRFVCISPHCMYVKLCNEDPVIYYGYVIQPQLNLHIIDYTFN
jgi:hypothetical protein